MFFKKTALLMAGALCVASLGFVSCSNDDDPEPAPEVTPATDPSEEFSNTLFSVPEGSFETGEMPIPDEGEPIQGISLNNQALTGGMNFVTVQSEKTYDSFLVGVKGQEGYWKIDGSAVEQTQDRSITTYIIPINFGTEYDGNIIIIIIAIDGNGTPSLPTEGEITHVDSKSGDLNINLTFSNAKDIDLHLYTPSNQHIYFGNRGGYTYIENEAGEKVEIEYGLDHDSNAACNIDNLNNENIFIPAELIEPGVYTVRVDLWSNCRPSIATTWAIVSRYKGEIVRPIEGVNPASGVYPVDAPSGDNTFVMSFQLKEGTPEASSAKHAPLASRKRPLTELDRFKLAYEAE